MMAAPPPVNGSTLEPFTRVITTHAAPSSPSDEPAAIYHPLTGPSPWQPVTANNTFSLVYTSDAKPDMTADADVSTYESLLDSGTLGLVNPNGSVCRCVDLGPAEETDTTAEGVNIEAMPLMHRTQSLDYGIVVSGEVELLLPGQPPRLMKQGDVAVQRATMHAWRNPSPTKACRMIFVLIASEKVKVDNGMELGQSLPHIPQLGEGAIEKAFTARRV